MVVKSQGIGFDNETVELEITLPPQRWHRGLHRKLQLQNGQPELYADFDSLRWCWCTPR